MNDRMDILKVLPPMLTGDALRSALRVLPVYDEMIRGESDPVRLAALSDLYQIYLPSQMSVEIYSKLYLALLRSLQKKGTRPAVQQRNENHKAVLGQAYRGIMGGSDSFTIIGSSGIGKTSAISRAMELITAGGNIETQQPYSKVIPCLNVQCPFDSSVKSLMLEILRKTDEELGTAYYPHAIRTRASTVDTLIGTVSSVALNHIGLLVVDEIQNVVNSKNGKSLVGMLTQLINNSGISICMVGTSECIPFFEQAMQLARRSVGLQYGRMEYDRYFRDFCAVVFGYQYVRRQTELDTATLDWLYEHSAGVVAVVVSLIHDAQEIAILNGSESLNLTSLREAYRKRMALLHGHIEPGVEKQPYRSSVKHADDLPPEQKTTIEACSVSEIVRTAKDNETDVVELLKQHYSVVEVVV